MSIYNEVLNKITSSDNFDELQQIINLCEKQKRKIIHDKFENQYKELAGDKYKEIEQLLSDIHLYNIDNNLYKDLSNYIYSNYHNLAISRILERMEILNMEVPPSLQQMACQCCTCGNCPSMIECIGVDCNYCKKHGYTTYQYDCDE